MHTRLTKLLSALLAGMSLCCYAPTARAGVFEPDVYGNGLSLNQYMREVPGGGQPGGPAYTFFMGKYEITNGQFAAFLNDAQLDGGATGKGSNMYFEANGNIRISQGGLTLFRVDNRITYDPGAPVGQRYEYTANAGEPNFGYHPVGMVSWFGALKFCNWLTLDQGLGESEVVYHEGPTAGDWHPMSISTTDYQTRDLNTAERQDLVDNYLGFRVPMDNRAETAAPFNEFYKAAAWSTTALVNRTYGFGRDTIDVHDANGDIDIDQLDDPFEPDEFSQTTPVGFYDGTNWQRSQWNWPAPWTSFQTRINANAYGIYDLSGDVWEWQQDKASDPSFNRDFRGGGFATIDLGLRADYRNITGPSMTSPTIGFRIAQVPEPSTGWILLVGLYFASCGRRSRSKIDFQEM